MLASSRSSLTALAVLAAVAMASSLAHAQSSQSLLSSVAIGSVVAMSVTASEAVTAVSGEGGSLTTLSELPAASINFAVESVRFVGDTAILLLRYAPQGAEFAVQLSGKVVEDAGLAAGQSVRALAVTSGHVLMSGGKMIAMLPDAASRALWHDERISQ